MNSDVHQMSLLVGTLTGRLDALTKSVESLNELWGQREQAASEGRRVLHEKIGTMAHDLQRVEASVENMVRDISDTIRPAVESFKTDRDREDGAAAKASKISKTFFTVAGMCSGVTGAILMDIIHKYWK